MTKSHNNRAAYMREYYLKNKTRLMERRRNRYQQDAEYRAEYNRQRRARSLLQRTEEFVQSAQPTEEVVLVPTYKMKVVSPDRRSSAIVSMYTLREVALALGISKEKIVHWIYLEKLPEPKYRNANNWRLYTEYEVEFLKRGFARFKKKARLENYKFRMTRELSDYLNDKFRTLVGGVPSDVFESVED